MATTPTISPLPEAPNRNTDSPSSFSSKTDSFLSAIRTFQGEANTVAEFAGNAAKSAAGIGLAFYQDIELADTNNSDPGDGKLKFNNATQTSATALYLDDLDANSTNVRDLIADFDNTNADQVVKGDLSLRDRQDPTKWLVYEVTGITQNSGYTTVAVQSGVGASSSPFADTDTVVVGYTRAGIDGKTFNLRGAWDAGTAYDESDVVSHDGGAFIANQDTTAGDEPRDSTKWDRLTGDAFNTRGAWASGTAYAINDIVSHNGTAYVALQDTNAGDEPGVSSKWETFATAGDVTSVNGQTGAVTLNLTSVQIDTFTSSGTWSKASGAKLIEVEMWSGGGGGGSGDRGAGGGGGGSYARHTFFASDLGGSESVQIGSGGAGGTGGSEDGAAGGSSSFGVHITLQGGKGGKSRAGDGGASGGDGADAYYGPQLGPVDTTDSESERAKSYDGGTGGVPLGSTSATVGGGGVFGGAGGGGTTENRDPRAPGNAMFGGAGGGSFGDGSNPPTTSGGISSIGGNGGDGADGVGSNGIVPAGGGGGGGAFAVGNTGDGGDGARGEVRVIQYL